MHLKAVSIGIASGTTLDSLEDAGGSIGEVGIRPIDEPVFPVELWAEICRHVDDRTLWMGVRRTSHALLVEAEREMKLTRLAKLRLKWRFRFEREDSPRCVSLYVGLLTVNRIAGYSKDDQCVYFGAIDGLPSLSHNGTLLSTNNEPFFQLSNVHPGFRTTCADEMRYRERGPVRIDDYTAKYDRSIVLSGIVRQIELPELQVHFAEEQISFEWRRFLTDLLMDNALERSQRRVQRRKKDAQGQQEERSRLRSEHRKAFVKWKREFYTGDPSAFH
ncbi:hypothetical protein NX059_011992 [Plenodomus lindquistii]|nr:hypothetical protein NX059_011992 [Plenodomus lindquistii]